MPQKCNLPFYLTVHIVLSWRYLRIKRCIDSLLRAQTEMGNKCGRATKKHEISRTLLSINLHFLVNVTNKYQIKVTNIILGYQ